MFRGGFVDESPMNPITHPGVFQECERLLTIPIRRCNRRGTAQAYNYFQLLLGGLVKILTRDRNIEHWDAEDIDAWEAGGKDIAKRNLIWSIFAEHVGFSVWSIWSVMVLFMPQAVYHIDAAGKFFLVAVPTLVGSILRLPYTFAVAKFGGRNWTVFSALVLLVPTLLTLYYLAHPGTSYTTFMIVA